MTRRRKGEWIFTVRTDKRALGSSDLQRLELKQLALEALTYRNETFRGLHFLAPRFALPSDGVAGFVFFCVRSGKRKPARCVRKNLGRSGLYKAFARLFQAEDLPAADFVALAFSLRYDARTV